MIQHTRLVTRMLGLTLGTAVGALIVAIAPAGAHPFAPHSDFGNESEAWTRPQDHAAPEGWRGHRRGHEGFEPFNPPRPGCDPRDGWHAPYPAPPAVVIIPPTGSFG